ncbi:5207_t:CDS:2, partial [Gigaspora margarita]
HIFNSNHQSSLNTYMEPVNDFHYTSPFSYFNTEDQYTSSLSYFDTKNMSNVPSSSYFDIYNYDLPAAISSSPHFNTDEHDINVKHDIADALSSTSFNIYNCDASNSLSSPYFNTYDDNTNIPTTSLSSLSHFNANDFNGTFVESDIEIQPEDADNEKEGNEYDNEDEQGGGLLYISSKINEQNNVLTPTYQVRQSRSVELPQPLFQHLIRFKQTPNVVQLHGPKQKYGFGIGYAKKALDLAIRTNKVNDLVNELEHQDQDDNDSAGVQDPLRVRYKGRQPKRYKSDSELPKKVMVVGNKKGERHCQKCKKTGHYALRCPN